jgi:hypothetical protein
VDSAVLEHVPRWIRVACAGIGRRKDLIASAPSGLKLAHTTDSGIVIDGTDETWKGEWLG